MADIRIFTITRKTYHGFVLSSQCVHQVGNLGFTDTQTHSQLSLSLSSVFSLMQCHFDGTVGHNLTVLEWGILKCPKTRYSMKFLCMLL